MPGRSDFDVSAEQPSAIAPARIIFLVMFLMALPLVNMSLHAMTEPPGLKSVPPETAQLSQLQCDMNTRSVELTHQAIVSCTNLRHASAQIKVERSRIGSKS